MLVENTFAVRGSGDRVVIEKRIQGIVTNEDAPTGAIAGGEIHPVHNFMYQVRASSTTKSQAR